MDQLNSRFRNIQVQELTEIERYFKRQNTSSEIIKLAISCTIKVNPKGIRKSRILVMTNNAMYVFKKADLRYKVQYKEIQKIVVAKYSSDYIIATEDEGWIIDSFEYRSAIIGLSKLFCSKSISFKVKDDTFLDGELKNCLRKKNKESKQRKYEKVQVMNLRNMKKQWFMEKNIKEGANEHILSKYQIKTALLSNEYWQTFLANEIEKNENVTIKVYKKQIIKKQKQILFYIINQVVNLKNVLSPYVPTLHRFFYIQSYIIFVTDFYDGLLLSELDKNELKKPQVLRMLIGQIVMGIGHLHDCGIIYGDLGLHSVLINHDGHILLINIGMSRQKNQAMNCEPKNSSPQSIITNKASPDLDWWHLGMLIYEIVEGKHYFQSKSADQIKEILESNEQLDLQKLYLPKGLQQLRQVIQGLLKKNYRKRLGYKNDYHEILSYKFFGSLNKKQMMVKEGEVIKKLAVKKKIKSEDIRLNKNCEQIKEYDNILSEHTYSKDLDEF